MRALLKEQREDVVLPVGKPAVSSFPSYSAPLAILEYQPDNEWILNNFISLKSKTDKNGIWVRYHNVDMNHIPGLQIICGDIDAIKEYPSILEFIIANINKRTYVKLVLDMYYIPDSEYYGTKHVLYPVLIYGYNLAGEQIYVAGFSNKQFGFTHVSAKQFLQAFESINYDINPLNLPEIHLHEIIFYVKDDTSEGTGCSLDVHQICAHLDEYIKPNQIEIIEQEQWNVGVSIYDVLIAYIERCRMGQYAYANLNRMTRILIEHKQLMVRRLTIIEKRFFCDLKDEIAQYKDSLKLLLDARDGVLDEATANLQPVNIELLNKVRHQEAQTLHSAINKLGVLRDATCWSQMW